MNISLIFASLLAAGLGLYIRRRLTKGWERFWVSPEKVKFPKVCPICLSTRDVRAVIEESSTRQTAYYVVAERIEWRKVRIFYCGTCADRLERATFLGILFGGVCGAAAVVLYFFMDPSLDNPIAMLCCSILFGTPAFFFFTTRRKGIILGKLTSGAMLVRAKHPSYRLLMEPVETAASESVPLPDGNGVWIRE